MRALTKKETELLVGGVETQQLDGITVHGSYFDTSISFDVDAYNPSFDYTVYDGYFPDNEGGSGGGGEPSYPCNSHDPNEVAQYTRELASQLRAQIVANSAHTHNEILAFMYRDEFGVIRATPLIGAGQDHVSVNFQELGFEASQIVGFIHNHDADDYAHTQEEALMNRVPSIGNAQDGGDWWSADNLVAHGVNPNELTLYVIDTTDVMREYRYSDKATYTSHPVSSSTPLGATVANNLQPECPL